MRFPLRRSRDGGAALAAAILLLPASLLASDDPVNTRPAPGPVQEVESLVIPRTDLAPEPDDRRLDVLSLSSLQVAADATQRGGILTDASYGLPTGPTTPGERLKLDAARAAVEAARAAGKLFITELPDCTLPATREEMAAMKMQQLEARRSVPPAPDPVAGIGEDLKAVQETGPSGLTPAEEAKLRGEELPVQTIPVVPATPAPVGDGAPVSPRVLGPEGATHE